METWNCFACWVEYPMAVEVCDSCGSRRDQILRETASKTKHTHFEVDGEKIAYQPTVRKIGIVG